MTAITGKSASFSFGGTVYGATSCIQESGLEDAINEVIYQCNGQDIGVAGTRSVVFSVSLAIGATEHAKITALAEGATGVFEYHPGGNSVGNIELEATRGIITSAPLSAPVNGVFALDLTIRLNGITIQAAT